MWSLSTALYGKYEANIRSLKNFRRDWIVGSTNQRTSNLIDHATSDVHKAAMAKLKVERLRVSNCQSRSGVFVIDGRRNAREDGEEVRCVLHDG